jgi:hypothetical protein
MKLQRMNCMGRLLCISILWMFVSCSEPVRLFKNPEYHPVQQAIATALHQQPASDDPADYDKSFQEGEKYLAIKSEPFWLIPSTLLPDSMSIQTSNNNVSLVRYGNRIYLAFRTSKNHFASEFTQIHIISTADGLHWDKELEVKLGTDVREPFLLLTNDTLRFYYFKAGTSMTSFSPDYINMIYKVHDQGWSEPQRVMEKGEVHWSMKKRNERYFSTSYKGSHYNVFGKSKVELKFKQSYDGVHWTNVGDSAMVYQGGVSEVDFEFDRNGDLWAVGRLEDGDFSGFGTQLFYASKQALDKWSFLPEAIKEAHMSPKVFRHNDDIYLIARRQLGEKPFGFARKFLGMPLRRLSNWVNYSLSPKTTALFRLNKQTKTLEHLMDIPGAGDTALPSVMRLGKDRFLIANYTSDPKHSRRSWLKGQMNPTYVYLMVLDFKKL